jgi:hypothetical protein
VIALPPLVLGKAHERVMVVVVEVLTFRNFGAEGALEVVMNSPVKYSLAPTLLIAEIRTL